MEKMLEILDAAIPAGRTLRIRNARGVMLRVAEGVGWITEEGDNDDYALGPGNSRRIGTSGLTLVHAFEDARVALEAGLSSEPFTVDLGGGYNEYAAAVWHEQLAHVWRRLLRRLGYSLARASRAGALKASAGPR
jgi:hypothetical protein